MQVVSISLSKQDLAQLNALAKIMDCKRSEAIRRLIALARINLSSGEIQVSEEKCA
jgi:metal-responsive CopG/Arc/MetJ family transcriptional regulator